MKITEYVTARDGARISIEHDKNGADSLVVVAPGFFNSKKNRWMQKTAEMLKPFHDTILFDFRGHGESNGKFTWSAKEHWDLEAVLDYAHSSQGYRVIHILAFSLGAAATINLLSQGRVVESAALISCPASFWGIEYHFWRPEMFADLKDNIECDWEGKGARTGFILLPKPKPIYNVKRIKETRLLFIHGDRDWIIHDRHSRQLFAAAGAPDKKLEIIPGGFHAERLIQQFPEQMRELIINWLSPNE